jgi:NTE family protein
MRALVLSGGASKGAYQVGVLKHTMGDLRLQYDAIYGVSVGAINGGWLSMYPHGQEVECIENLENTWRSLDTSTIYVDWLKLPWPLSYVNYLVALFKPSIYNSAPVMKLIRDNFDQDRMIASGKKFRVGAVSLNTGEYRVFDETTPNMADAIIASSSYPAAFIPIEIDGELWTDGGVRQVTPLKSAISLGYDAIDVVVTSTDNGAGSFSGDTLVKIGPRIVDIMSEEIMTNDLIMATKINELIKSGVEIPGKRYIDIRIFRPQESLPGSSLEFDQESIRKKIDIGYEDAKRYINA